MTGAVTPEGYHGLVSVRLTERKPAQAGPGQLTLSGLGWELQARPRAPLTARSASEEPCSALSGPVECPVGCRGTTSCLCGQGELSDDPVWIEND